VAVLSGSMAIVSSLIDSAVDLFTGFMLWLASRKNRKHNPYLYPIGMYWVLSNAVRQA
jgi:divalent metal cation (Fe/Co/Zn/Cd) transporter